MVLGWFSSQLAITCSNSSHALLNSSQMSHDPQETGNLQSEHVEEWTDFIEMYLKGFFVRVGGWICLIISVFYLEILLVGSVTPNCPVQSDSGNVYIYDSFLGFQLNQQLDVDFRDVASKRKTGHTMWLFFIFLKSVTRCKYEGWPKASSLNTTNQTKVTWKLKLVRLF